MKKKVLLLAGFCAVGLCTWEAQGKTIEKAPFYFNNGNKNMPNEFELINLMGDLLFGVSPNAIEAGANDEAVYIGFNQDFGLVNISIYNSMGGLVYSAVVNTSVQQVVIIPITFATSGTYTVELSNAFGYAEGDFGHLNNN
jgi:hypothetical protein